MSTMTSRPAASRSSRSTRPRRRTSRPSCRTPSTSTSTPTSVSSDRVCARHSTKAWIMARVPGKFVGRMPPARRTAGAPTPGPVSVSSSASLLPGFGDQRVQHRADRGSELTRVGSAVPFGEPAQRQSLRVCRVDGVNVTRSFSPRSGSLVLTGIRPCHRAGSAPGTPAFANRANCVAAQRVRRRRRRHRVRTPHRAAGPPPPPPTTTAGPRPAAPQPITVTTGQPRRSRRRTPTDSASPGRLRPSRCRWRSPATGAGPGPSPPPAAVAPRPLAAPAARRPR